MNDPTPAHLDALEPYTASLALDLVNAARAAGVPLIISSSRRSEDEQRALVAAGRSRTLESAHLRGEAFDVDLAGLRRDFVPRWLWPYLGRYGEALGLIWGGRFHPLARDGIGWDPAHFELAPARWG